MLCQFTFKNYKSFRDEATLDMQAAPISEHEESLLIDSDGERFLPLAVLYGPNGSGKSTVLEAFAFLIDIVMRPIRLLKNDKEFRTKSLTQTIPFKFDEKSVDGPTDFELFFRAKSAEYKYSLQIKKDVIIHESLYKQNKKGQKQIKIFVRDKNTKKVEVGQLLKSLEKTDVSETMPFLSYLEILTEVPVVNEVIRWFKNCEIINYGNPIFDMRVVLFENSKGQSIMLKMLQEMDVDISDLRYEKGNKDDELEIFTKHVVQSKEFELKLHEESSGTRKLFGFLPLIIGVLKNGGVMIIDEMDAKLHPKLIRYIIELFNNPKSNPHKAQLIFTSHDSIDYEKRNISAGRDLVCCQRRKSNFKALFFSGI